MVVSVVCAPKTCGAASKLVVGSSDIGVGETLDPIVVAPVGVRVELEEGVNPGTEQSERVGYACSLHALLPCESIVAQYKPDWHT